MNKLKIGHYYKYRDYNDIYFLLKSEPNLGYFHFKATCLDSNGLIYSFPYNIEEVNNFTEIA